MPGNDTGAAIQQLVFLMKYSRAPFELSETARLHLTSGMSRSGLQDPVIGLLREMGASHMMVGYYEKAELPINEPVYLLREQGGLDILIIQESLLKDLVGHRIDVRDGILVAVEPA